jgi:hypothetical protein
MSAARQYTTTTAPVETATGRGTRLVLAEGGVASRPTVPLSVLLLGIVTVIVGGWGAAAPFAGPDFGFVADRFTAWQWSTTSALLALVPGALALVCGLWVLGAATRRSYGRRPDLWFLGLVVTLCGAWFAVGQYVWPVLYGRHFLVHSGSGPMHFMLKEFCFAVGPGVILVLCGSLFMGWAVRRELAVVAERYPRVVEPAAVPAPMAGAPAAAVPVAEQPATTATGPVETMAPPPVVERPAVQQQVVRDPATGQTVMRDPVTGQTGVVAQPVGEPVQPVGEPAQPAQPVQPVQPAQAGGPGSDEPVVVRRRTTEPGIAGTGTGTGAPPAAPPA